MQFVTTARDTGQRLDRLLAAHASVPVNEARRWIADGRVRIDGHQRRKGTFTQDNQFIEVDVPGEQVTPHAAFELEILHEDQDLIVVDKPAGVAVHPYSDRESQTLLNAVAAYVGSWPVGIGEGGLRSGVVHRLDLPTSGCVVFAKTQAMHERLRHAWQEREVLKLYTADVALDNEVQTGQWEHPLKVMQHQPARVQVVAEDTKGSRACVLEVIDVQRHEAYQRLTLQLHSGFLHQIRAMCAHRGHWIIGDERYGGAAADRLHLHAHRLAIPGLFDAGCAVPF